MSAKRSRKVDMESIRAMIGSRTIPMNIDSMKIMKDVDGFETVDYDNIDIDTLRSVDVRINAYVSHTIQWRCSDQPQPFRHGMRFTVH